MKPRCPNNERHHNDLVLAVLESATVPMGPSAIAKRLELQGTHRWAYSPNCRVLVYAILQRIKAVRHPGGKFTSPV